MTPGTTTQCPVATMAGATAGPMVAVLTAGAMAATGGATAAAPTGPVETSVAATGVAASAVETSAAVTSSRTRNAVAHGLGKLTRRQLRSEQSVKSKLKTAGIRVGDNRIALSDDSLAAAASACRDFIERLDLAVQARG